MNDLHETHPTDQPNPTDHPDQPAETDDVFAHDSRETEAALARWRQQDLRHYIFCVGAIAWHLEGNLYPPLREWQDAVEGACAALREGARDRYIVVPVPDPAASDVSARVAYMTAEEVLARTRLDEWAETELAGDGLADDTPADDALAGDASPEETTS